MITKDPILTVIAEELIEGREELLIYYTRANHGELDCSLFGGVD